MSPGLGEPLVQVLFPGGGVQPEHHRPHLVDLAEQVVVAGELVDQARQRFAAGIVLDEARHPVAVLDPDAVPVRAHARRVRPDEGVVVVVGEGTHPRAARRGPPSLQPRVLVGTSVAGKVDEELVHPEQVRQVRPAGQMQPALPGGVLAGQVLAALRADDFDAELVEQVAVGVGAAVGFLRPEPVDHSEADELAQPALREVEGREQGVCDLEAGQHAMIGKPTEQGVITLRERREHSQGGVNHRRSLWALSPTGRTPGGVQSQQDAER